MTAGAGVTGGVATTGWRVARNGLVADGVGRGTIADEAGAPTVIGLKTGAELADGIGAI